MKLKQEDLVNLIEETLQKKLDELNQSKEVEIIEKEKEDPKKNPLIKTEDEKKSLSLEEASIQTKKILNSLLQRKSKK